MRNDKEENKNNGPVIPLYKKCPKCGTEYWITEEKCSKCGTELGDNDDASSAYKGETLEEEFAKAAKDGTLYEKYSEYLKRSEERLKDPYLANLKDSIKEDIRQLKEAYYKAAGLSKKICPKCGTEYENKKKFCPEDGTKLVEIWKCRHCGGDLTQAQGYSAIKVCPNCGKALDAMQQKSINSTKSGEPYTLKSVCSNEECGAIYETRVKFCEGCGSRVIPMQCSCGEIFRQREDGSFDKYCPKCGKHDPIVENEITKHREWINNLKAGDIIEFGSYPYEADGTKKPVEWRIPEKKADGTALVISKYGLDARRFDASSNYWENSEIRQWLNNDFYNKAFKNPDKSLIMETRLEQTSDKMFLLSIKEAEKYFSSDRDRICLPTPYAKTNKTKTGRPVGTSADYGGSCWWWLRSPGSDQLRAALVDIDGFVDAYGDDVVDVLGGVRAALKINLKNL